MDKSSRKSSGTNVAAKNATSVAVVNGSGRHGGERQHGGARPTQDAGAADRPDDARSSERRGKASAQKPNTRDTGHAANGNHETAYLANIEEPQPSTSHGGQGQRGARRLRSPNMAGDSSHSDMNSDPSHERQSDSDSDSSDSGEERAARRRHKGRKHKRKSKRSRKHGKKRRYRSPSSCDSSSETSSDTDSDDAPPRPTRRRRHRVRSRHMRNGSPSDSEPEQNGGPLSLHDANGNSAEISEESDDPYEGLIDTVQAQRNQQVAQAIGSGTTSNFAQILAQFEDFYATAEKTGEDVNNAFASIFNAGLRRQPNDKRLLELMEDYPRPGNVPFLIVPKTDEFAHNKLGKGPKVVDGLIQKIQTVMSKALVPLMHEISDMGDGVATQRSEADRLKQMTDAARLISAAFNLASQARKEVIRNNLKFPLNQLCNWSHSVGDTTLFGADAIKKAKELEDQTRTIAGMGHNRRYGSFRDSFGGGYGYDHGGRRGKQFRGRRRYHGYQRPSAHQPSKFKAKSTVTKQSFKRKRDSGEKSQVCAQSDNTINDQQKSQVTKLCNTEPLPHIDLRNTPENFVGGKLANHLAEWQSLTSDIYILNAIRGYSIPFTEMPSQERAPRPIHMKPDEIDGLNLEINSFLNQGIIEECLPYEGGSYYSNLFTRVKRDGSLRVIINLKKLTPQIEKQHFKMETIKDVIHMMRPNCLFGSIDFKHAFFSVRICENDRKYLRFQWKSKHYQFTSLPQGLGPASRLFTKLLKPVLAHLRSRGLEISAYIDDSITIHDPQSNFTEQMVYAVRMFDKLGFTINVGKSVLPPNLSDSIEHLGFVLNSKNMTVSLTEKKMAIIKQLAAELINKNVTIQKLASFIGKVVASEPGFDHAPIYYKEIEIFKNEQLASHKGNYNAQITLPQHILDMIAWWRDNIQNAIRHVVTPRPEFCIESDASNTGWGGQIVESGKTTRGHWSHDELNLHINVKELQAALFLLQALCSDRHDTHIRLKLDNTTAVACINRMASTKHHLMQLTRKIWLWAIQRNLTLSAEHLPGIMNNVADFQSRVVENIDTEWMLKPALFKCLCNEFGTPTIDMFASRLNHQLPKFVSWRPDPEAIAIDAFMQSWTLDYVYLFPPFSLIGRVLQKIQQDAATAILLMPVWPTKAWFPTALRMLAAHPVLLPRQCIMLPQDPQMQHPLCHLKLAAILVSGDHSRQLAYQRELRRSSSSHGNMELMPSTRALSKSGTIFAIPGSLIHSRPL